jgi:hypothetical protein
MATVDEFEVVKEVQVGPDKRAACSCHALAAQRHQRRTQRYRDTACMEQPRLTHQEFFADYLVQYPSHFTLTPAALADGGDGPPNVRFTIV